MNGMALLLVLTTPGIEYGWNPGPDGQLEYVIQLEPQALDALRGGQSISSDIDPKVRSVRRIVLKVGEGPVPRIAIAPEALEEDADEEADAIESQEDAQPRSRDRAAPGRSRAGPNATGRTANTVTQGNRGAGNGGTRRSPPQLVGGRSRPVGATISSDDSSESEDGFEESPEDDDQFTVTDDATEDGGGPYGRMRSPSRYTDISDDENPDSQTEPIETDEQTGEESNEELWSRWNQTMRQNTGQNRWQPAEPEEEEPVVDDRASREANAAWEEESRPWEQESRPSRRFESQNDPRRAPRSDRSDVQHPELASRPTTNPNVQDRGTHMPTGYSESTAPTNVQPNPATTPTGDSSSASDVSNPGLTSTNTLPTAAATTPASGLFKELLLFASLGVNVAAVIIARQYYLRYTMLVHEIRESETLSS